MQEHTYCVNFVDVGIMISQIAVLGEIAVANAEKELKEMYGENVNLGNKISVWMVE